MNLTLTSTTGWKVWSPDIFGDIKATNINAACHARRSSLPSHYIVSSPDPSFKRNSKDLVHIKHLATGSLCPPKSCYDALSCDCMTVHHFGIAMHQPLSHAAIVGYIARYQYVIISHMA